MNPGLNGFRFFAFLGVFLFHVGLFPAGYLGVQAFFVLSGFLITPILLETKSTSSTFSEYIRNFLVRRFLRIFPLYYFYLVGLVLVITLFGLEAYGYFFTLKNQLIYGFTFTYNFYHQTIYCRPNSFLSHFWSLAIEEQFYLIWPLFIYVLSNKGLKQVMIVLCLLGPFLRWMIGYAVDQHWIGFLSDDKKFVVYLSTFSHLDAFAIGGLFALLRHGMLKNIHIMMIITTTILIGLWSDYLTGTHVQLNSLGYGQFMQGGLKYIWGYSLLNVCFACIIYGLRSRIFLPFIFENKRIVSLGLISYGLYVFHFGMICITQAMYNFLLEQGILVNYLIFDPRLWALIFTVLISLASYHLFEKKFILFKEKLAPKYKSIGKTA